MTPDDTSPNTDAAGELGTVIPPRARRTGFGARHMLFAGVAGACVLGAGLGFWARPGLAERRGAIAAPQAEVAVADPAAHKLHIVLDDHPGLAATPTDMTP